MARALLNNKITGLGIDVLYITGFKDSNKFRAIQFTDGNTTDLSFTGGFKHKICTVR